MRIDVVPYKDPADAKRNARERYLRDREQRIEYARRQRRERGEDINARRRELRTQWSEEKLEAAAEYDRRWYDEHPGVKRDRSRKRREAHPEDRDYLRVWRQLNREAVCAYSAQRRGRAVEGMTAQDKIESIEWRKLIAEDPCLYCGTADAEVYETDHFISIANGGTDHWWNLVRACQSCNRAKLAMNGEEFLALLSDS